MTHSLTIEVPDHIILADRPRPILIKFNTREEQLAYVVLEARYCAKASRQLSAAWNADDRRAAYVHLFEQRKKCYELTFKKPIIAPESA